ncbi:MULTISPECIES: PaaI family thioesterase [Desulfatibacillum]|uniref:Thioesterase domain-containing protein, putative n=1 Tax=Desulfatibacillum alkenivorans DSM 16219 TaxID=1121393 RepID=A0A1M6R9M8_9BACT|nr:MULTISPECIES: PaaI family thioesterase [Desulfatibacillum]SHK29028.1 thioesterase domain-containing protein, putative [Desulfatibacillum alkenivorans DSM 16219]
MSNHSDPMISIIEEGIDFVKRMGLKVVDLKRGYCKLSAPIKGNENHIGTMYAGALFTLAEIPGGALSWSSFDLNKFFPIIKEMSISYRRPVTTDAYVEISISEDEIARIEEEASTKGKSDFILEGEIKDESGQVTALSKGLYQLRLRK